ncbi:hypothetical protein PoB_006616900 [Plakobranchus ocellatus]|uniref:Uncharacterized protein n=1 Tax=Plakobranchus ocellatus TaxID=259542 RepID=A0AAV4D668_9GAST|nr:hypothetical protein PoB_006616900 [Plakobranchus ocellatus]
MFSLSGVEDFAFWRIRFAAVLIKSFYKVFANKLRETKETNFQLQNWEESRENRGKVPESLDFSEASPLQFDNFHYSRQSEQDKEVETPDETYSDSENSPDNNT